MALAVSEMSRAEQNQAEENPRLLKAQQMTGSIRWLELYRSYLLAEELDDISRDRHTETIDHWAHTMGMTPATLKSHLGWARAIDMQILLDMFEGEGIPEQEWTQRIGTSHLKEIAKAKDQATDRVLTPGEMVTLVIECFHGNWSVDELKTELRQRNLRAPAKGVKSDPTKNLTACSLLSEMAEELAKAGIDIDLGILPEKWGEPAKVSRILWKLASKFEEKHKEATWAPKAPEKAPGSPQDGKEA